MITAQLTYVDLFLILVAAGLFFFSFFVRREMIKNMAAIQGKIAELEGKHNTLLNFKNALTNRLVNLNKASDYLQKLVEEKVKTLTQSITDINEKNKLFASHRDEVLVKVDEKVDPLKVSLDETSGQIKQFRDALDKILDENEKGLKELSEKLNLFSSQVKKEMQTMKNSIRERTIDLEL